MPRLVALVLLCLCAFGPDSRAADLSGDVGVIGISGVQWRMIPARGIRICADGQVWLANGQCSSRSLVPGEAVPAFPSGGVSPAQYVRHYFGRGAELINLQPLPPYGEQPPTLELVYALGTKEG